MDVRFERERGLLQPPDGRTPYVHIDREDRKVARDAYVDWGSSRYSVPWKFVGRTVGVRELDGRVEVYCGLEPIASHGLARDRHQVVTQAPHHAGIPLGADDRGGKILVRMGERAPQVEIRPLAAYESLAGGGGR